MTVAADVSPHIFSPREISADARRRLRGSWKESFEKGGERLARNGRRQADQIGRADSAPNDSALARVEAIGETPMTATATVALPI